MTRLRRDLRLLAMIWLMLQAATLSAFVPRDCCKTHRPAADVPHCALAASGESDASGTAERTTMHRAEALAEPGSAGSGENVVRALCGTPPVFTLFANPGILTAAPMTVPGASVSMPAPPGDETAVARTCPPTDRPPRS